MSMQRIKFKDEEYLLVANSAIATEEQYRSGTVSYAHLDPDGNIYRHCEIIGTIDDIEILGEANVEMSDEGIFNLVTGRGWPT